MPAFMKLGDIKGQATDQGHKDWILIQLMNTEIHRTIPENARDHQRTQGSTQLRSVVVRREVDKSSNKIKEACANGTFYPEVELHFCTTVKNKQEPFLSYKLKNVIISFYNSTVNGSGMPLPAETIALEYTDAEWTYTVVDPETGDKKGNVPAKYNPAQGKS